MNPPSGGPLSERRTGLLTERRPKSCALGLNAVESTDLRPAESRNRALPKPGQSPAGLRTHGSGDRGSSPGRKRELRAA